MLIFFNSKMFTRKVFKEVYLKKLSLISSGCDIIVCLSQYHVIETNQQILFQDASTGWPRWLIFRCSSWRVFRRNWRGWVRCYRFRRILRCKFFSFIFWPIGLPCFSSWRHKNFLYMDTHNDLFYNIERTYLDTRIHSFWTYLEVL